MRIGIIGHFGGNEIFTDGQTVKVLSIYSALDQYAHQYKIDKVDTYYVNRKPSKLIIDFLKCLCLDKKIIFFPAFRGRTVLFKLLYYVSIVFKRGVYHCCIAGSLDEEIAQHPEWIRYLNQFRANWMESPQQVEVLKKIGIKNVSYMPNFKQLSSISKELINSMKYERPYRFCTFSRVEPMKGIEDALQAIRNVNCQRPNSAILDVYGPIQPGEEDWFNELSANYKEELNYKGVVDPMRSVEVLKDYLALLFPTRYYTEGMPGTIIDAMYAGLPVVARKWKWCDNMITNGHNGIVYDFNKPALLNSILLSICEDPNIIISLKNNCILESRKYSSEVIVKKLLKDIELK